MNARFELKIETKTQTCTRKSRKNKKKKTIKKNKKRTISLAEQIDFIFEYIVNSFSLKINTNRHFTTKVKDYLIINERHTKINVQNMLT